MLKNFALVVESVTLWARYDGRLGVRQLYTSILNERIVEQLLTEKVSEFWMVTEPREKDSTFPVEIRRLNRVGIETWQAPCNLEERTHASLPASAKDIPIAVWNTAIWRRYDRIHRHVFNS